MRVLITGSRDWPSRGFLEEVITAHTLYIPGSEITIVTGAAVGADAMAEAFARKQGWKVESHPVSKEMWKEYGKRAGHIRNSHMVSLGADRCLAFIYNKSPGATGCSTMAKNAHIPAFIIEG